MNARSHLTRGGLSLAVTGLIATVLTTGATHVAVMGSMNDLSMQRTAWSALITDAATIPATTVTTPATGDLTFDLSVKAITGVPSLVAPGYHRITEVQEGKGVRDMLVVRLKNSSYTVAQLEKDGRTASGEGSAADKALLRIIKNVEGHGGTDTSPSIVSATTRAHTPKVVYTTDLTAGTYVVANQDADDAKHTTYTVFTVPAGTPVGTKPSVAGTFKPHEYGFDVPSSLTTGSKLYAFKDTGQQGHIDALAKVPTGTTADQVLTVIESNGPPAPGFVLDTDLTGLITKGQTIYRKLDFKPGTYALICFLPEQVKKNGPPHFEEGMIRVFTVS